MVSVRLTKEPLNQEARQVFLLPGLVFHLLLQRVLWNKYHYHYREILLLSILLQDRHIKKAYSKIQTIRGISWNLQQIHRLLLYVILIRMLIHLSPISLNGISGRKEWILSRQKKDSLPLLTSILQPKQNL